MFGTPLSSDTASNIGQVVIICTRQLSFDPTSLPRALCANRPGTSTSRWAAAALTNRNQNCLQLISTRPSAATRRWLTSRPPVGFAATASLNSATPERRACNLFWQQLRPLILRSFSTQTDLTSGNTLIVTATGRQRRRQSITKAFTMMAPRPSFPPPDIVTTSATHGHRKPKRENKYRTAHGQLSSSV